MRSAQDYQRQLHNYDLNVSIGSVSEAKAMIKQLSQAQKELRLVKKEIAQDVKMIRSEYSQRMAGAAVVSSGVLTLFGQRKAAGSVRAGEKRRLKSEQDARIQPYQNVSLAIDRMINDMDKSKISLERFVVEQNGNG